MYLLTITKCDRIKEYLVEVEPDENYIQNIIEDEFIQTAKEAGDYYTDREKYMEDVYILVLSIHNSQICGYFIQVKLDGILMILAYFQLGQKAELENWPKRNLAILKKLMLN